MSTNEYPLFGMLLTFLCRLLNWAIAYSTPYLVNSDPGDAKLGSKVFVSLMGETLRMSETPLTLFPSVLVVHLG